MQVTEENVYRQLAKLGIDQSTAKSFLETLAKEMANALTQDPPVYEIEGFGTFQKTDVNGAKQIQFQPDPKFLKQIETH